jgi:hypothetical protein
VLSCARETVCVVRFKIFTAVTILVVFFRVKSPCGWVGRNQRFVEACCLHLQDWSVICVVLLVSYSSCSGCFVAGLLLLLWNVEMFYYYSIYCCCCYYAQVSKLCQRRINIENFYLCNCLPCSYFMSPEGLMFSRWGAPFTHVNLKALCEIWGSHGGVEGWCRPSGFWRRLSLSNLNGFFTGWWHSNGSVAGGDFHCLHFSSDLTETGAALGVFIRCHAVERPLLPTAVASLVGLFFRNRMLAGGQRRAVVFTTYELCYEKFSNEE